MRYSIPAIIAVFVIGFGPGHSFCEAFELQDGDRVVLLGGGLIERAQRYGSIETRLTVALPDRNIVFRNLGWSGDTVYGHSRAPGRTGAVFGTPDEGFGNLIQQVGDSEPTVLIVGYGFNESFDGRPGLDPFRDGTIRLLDALQEFTKRIIVLSPHPQFASPSGDVNVDARNEMIADYAAVLHSEAESRGLVYVDLLSKLNDRAFGSTYGVHLSPSGYELVATEIAAAVNLQSIEIISGPDAARAEELRQKIVAKNRLFLHSWRPRNTAFITGERKDEQAPSHFDVPKFVPLVEKAEQEINELKKKSLRSRRR